MSLVGAPGSEDRKKFIAIVAFAVVAAGVLYFELRDPNPTPTPASAVVTAPAPSRLASEAAPRTVSGPAATRVGATSAALDPTLHMDAMLVTESVRYEGTGRNIFSGISAPVAVKIPAPVAPARTVAHTVVPYTPPAPPVPCPPNCPPFPLKFFGTVESPPGSGIRRAFLLHDDDDFLAAAGDIVLRRYRVLSVKERTIEIEDMQNDVKQTLPLVAN